MNLILESYLCLGFGFDLELRILMCELWKYFNLTKTN